MQVGEPNISSIVASDDAALALNVCRVTLARVTGLIRALLG